MTRHLCMSASSSTSRSSTTSTQHIRMRSQSTILPRISEPAYSPLGDNKNSRERLMHYPWKKIALGAGLFVALLWLFNSGSSSGNPTTGAFTFPILLSASFHTYSLGCVPDVDPQAIHQRRQQQMILWAAANHHLMTLLHRPPSLFLQGHPITTTTSLSNNLHPLHPLRNTPSPQKLTPTLHLQRTAQSHIPPPPNSSNMP